MKESPRETIAKKLNVSPSLVGRVIRHSGGVDSETRHRILQEIQNYSTVPKGDFPVYAIFPDTPRFFWEPIRRGFTETLEKKGIPLKTNICTKVHDEAAILQYLDEAEQLNIQALVIATHKTPSILEKLKRMVPDRFILFLSEYGELPGTFYCGSDSFSDGYSMGRYYTSHFPEKKLILLSLPENPNYTKRVDGFLQAVSEADDRVPEEVIRVPVEWKSLTNFKLIPSKLAPLLLHAAVGAESYCLYSPDGIPQLPLAILKARLQDRMVLLCQDCYPYERPTCRIISCDQDGFLQGQTAALLVGNYVMNRLFPEEKRILVPSGIRVVDPGPSRSGRS